MIDFSAQLYHGKENISNLLHQLNASNDICFDINSHINSIIVASHELGYLACEKHKRLMKKIETEKTLKEYVAIIRKLIFSNSEKFYNDDGSVEVCILYGTNIFRYVGKSTDTLDISMDFLFKKIMSEYSNE